MQNGTIIRSQTGIEYIIENEFDNGGEGSVYMASKRADNSKGVIKIFNSNLNIINRTVRTRYLIQKELHRSQPNLITPRDLILTNNTVGYWMPYVPGEKLYDIIKKPAYTLKEGLQMGVDICQLVEYLHSHNIAYGDLNSKNLMVNKNHQKYDVYGIDLDNFYTPGVPPPVMIGQLYYISPEIRQAVINNMPTCPNIDNDLFSLGVVLSEVILLLSPAAGGDSSPEKLNHTMSLPWRFDPVKWSKYDNSFGNYPVAVLSSRLCRLFRKAINPNINGRPTASEWLKEIKQSQNYVYDCPQCDRPSIIDSSKRSCPWCKQQFEKLGLSVKKNHNVIPFNRPASSIGRNQINCSDKVSYNHIFYEIFGPQVWIKTVGCNGTFRWSGSQWIKLPDNMPILLSNNDKLKLADIEVDVININ